MTAWIEMHRREVLVDVTRRLLAHRRAGTTQLADRLMTRSAAVYRDPDRAERERRHLFGDGPIVAALSGQLRRPGDQLPMTVAGVPVVLTRAVDGTVHAFLNVCRHRGGAVATGPACGARLTCRYHGWSYDLEGSLVTLPGSEGFDGLDADARHLVEIPSEERHGVVWIATRPGAELDLDAFLGDFDAELGELSLGRLRHVHRRSVDVAANWHLAMDTSAESYHIGRLHAASLGGLAIGNLNVVDRFGPAQRVATANVSLDNLATSDEAHWRPEDAVQFIYVVFPNTTFVVTGNDNVGMIQIFPGTDVARCEAVLSFFSRQPDVHDEDPATIAARCEAMWHVVTAEDLPMAEEIQAGLAGASTFTFGRNEAALQHLHQAYDDADERSR